MIDNTQLIAAAKTVACIEVEGNAPENGKRYGGPFYPDDPERLVSFLRELPGRMQFVVAPDEKGLIRVYKKPRSKQ